MAVSPNRVYWTAFAIFGLAAGVDVAFDVAAGSIDSGTAGAAAGVLAIGYASVVAFRDPNRATVPDDWGPLVYFVVAGAALYTFGLALQLYTVVA